LKITTGIAITSPGDFIKLKNNTILYLVSKPTSLYGIRQIGGHEEGLEYSNHARALGQSNTESGVQRESRHHP